MRTINLGEIANVAGGYPFRGSIGPRRGGSHRVIQARDIVSGAVPPSATLTPTELGADAAAYLIRPGDVLFLSRGPELRATHVVEVLGPTVAAAYFHVVRPLPPARGDYLAWYLNQPPAQDTLRALVRGTKLRFVPKREFEQIPIELPPLAVQTHIAALDVLLRREARLAAELTAARRALVQVVALGAVRDGVLNHPPAPVHR